MSSTDRSVSFYQYSSVWLDKLDFRSWDRNSVDSNANPIYIYIYIYMESGYYQVVYLFDSDNKMDRDIHKDYF